MPESVITPDAVAAPFLVNQYPARITGPDGTILTKRARAVITDDLLVVYEHVNRKVQTTILRRHTGHTPERGVWMVTTVDGIYQIGPEKGCGCGSPLRRMMTPTPLFLNVEPFEVT